MNQRLQQFLMAENITQSQFADSIGVARANVSHIISGRNKPGFDFIEKMSTRYPSLNLEWLLVGKGKMYKNSDDSPSAQSAELFDTKQFTEPSPSVSRSVSDSVSPVEQSSDPVVSQDNVQSVRQTATLTLGKKFQTSNNQRNISRIIVFYDDNTFQELK